ncbi:peptidylprolyl isomerase [Priestia koreensis]|uniref:peptidylprolyl isomerase n=1 Tax=Priestia koreensis TaxID=284581 RepID=UPI003459AA48
MNKKAQMTIGCVLLVIAVGASALAISYLYHPILYVIGEKVVRTNDWQHIKHLYITNDQEEEKMLEMRSLEDLVVTKGKEMNIKANPREIQTQLEQLGKTSTERAKALKDLNMSEEESVQSIRRSTIGFKVKKAITENVKVSEQEMQQFYTDHQQAFMVPVFRTVTYMQSDHPLPNVNKNTMKSLNPSSRMKVVRQELVSFEQMKGEVGETIARNMFRAPLHELQGPIKEGPLYYWILVENETKEEVQAYPQVKPKIYSTLLMEKQNRYFQRWLEKQKEVQDYQIYPEHLAATKWNGFWEDFFMNIRLLVK